MKNAKDDANHMKTLKKDETVKVSRILTHATSACKEEMGCHTRPGTISSHRRHPRHHNVSLHHPDSRKQRRMGHSSGFSMNDARGKGTRAEQETAQPQGQASDKARKQRRDKAQARAEGQGAGIMKR
jgi:hypothetical protein